MLEQGLLTEIDLQRGYEFFDYPNDKRAIPPIIKAIETVLVARVRISMDSSSSRNGATLKILP